MMAALMKTHVHSSGDDAQPQCEDHDDQSNSEGGSDDERSDDGENDEGDSDGDGEGGSNGEEAEEAVEGDGSNANAGWADAMAKILGKKTLESRTSILVKSKELDKMKEKDRKEQLERKKQVDKKRVWEMMAREKPDVVKDRDTEKALQRIATRGVVQLFNAVRKHQKTIDIKVKEVGGSERKKAKFLSSVSKKDFIDVLRRTEGGSGASSRTEDTAAAAAEEPSSWKVLSDDFMMGATMKDWDKEEDDTVH
ncbi:RRP15-like protein [Cyclopterus lumpus]|uniref:RRP15-like protein n=1 Tax=Cyclopterus lumpus TaxID=8103 RepID=A0A8C2Z2J5_CYCLU|nr:RRP15-like protein [Cyclopterus lumpus]